MRRIGVLMSVAVDDPEGKNRFAAFEQGLQQLGWVDGRNVRIETRWSGGKSDDAQKYAAELIALKPDVILASGGAIVGPLLQDAGKLLRRMLKSGISKYHPDPLAALERRPS